MIMIPGTPTVARGCREYAGNKFWSEYDTTYTHSLPWFQRLIWAIWSVVCNVPGFIFLRRRHSLPSVFYASSFADIEFVFTYQILRIHAMFSPLTDKVVGGEGGWHEGRFSREPLPVSPAGCPCEQFWHGQRCPLGCCPSNNSSADHGVAHPLRCPERWFWRGCRDV